MNKRTKTKPVSNLLRDVHQALHLAGRVKGLASEIEKNFESHDAIEFVRLANDNMTAIAALYKKLNRGVACHLLDELDQLYAASAVAPKPKEAKLSRERAAKKPAPPAPATAAPPPLSDPAPREPKGKRDSYPIGARLVRQVGGPKR